jgi:hypothetical protein
MFVLLARVSACYLLRLLCSFNRLPRFRSKTELSIYSQIFLVLFWAVIRIASPGPNLRTSVSYPLGAGAVLT